MMLRLIISMTEDFQFAMRRQIAHQSRPDRCAPEDASLIDQISDEALEAAADMTNQAAYTLAACTGLSVCPAYQCALLAKFDEKGEELIRIADEGVDGKADPELQIKTRKWIMAKESPQKYGEIAVMPAPPLAH
jgi:hypothetical protein